MSNIIENTERNQTVDVGKSWHDGGLIELSVDNQLDYYGAGSVDLSPTEAIEVAEALLRAAREAGG